MRLLSTPVLIGMLLAPSLMLGAQGASARLRGTVTDAHTAAPVVGVRVVVAATSRVTLTDSTGRFEVNELPSGVIRFFFVADGYPRASVVLAFAPGEVMTQRFELDATDSTADSSVTPRRVQRLPATEVTAEVSRGLRYVDFERRLKSGRGQYVTRDQIEAAGSSSLGDAVRMLRGVAVECGGGRGCMIRMARAGQGCYPQYVVDGQVDNMFGPFVPVRDIEGVEVYTGASDVPGEFAGTNAGCGVVVIWTRVGPPKAKAKPKPKSP